MDNDYKVYFYLSEYSLSTGGVLRGIFETLERMYIDGVLKLKPKNIGMIDEDQKEVFDFKDIDQAVIGFDAEIADSNDRNEYFMTSTRMEDRWCENCEATTRTMIHKSILGEVSRCFKCEHEQIIYQNRQNK